MDLVGLALELDQALGELVQLRRVARDVAQQRHGLGGEPGRVGDDRDHLLHFRLELLELVEIDGGGGGVHLVHRIVHRADQAGDRAAVERRQEGAADRGQHLADDVVGVVLALVDLLDVRLHALAALTGFS